MGYSNHIVRGSYGKKDKFPLDCETLEALQNNTDLMAVIANIAADKDTGLILCGCRKDGNYRGEGYLWLRTDAHPTTGEILYHPKQYCGAGYGWQIREVTDSQEEGFEEVRPITVDGQQYNQAYSLRYIQDVNTGGTPWNELTHTDDVSNVALKEAIEQEADTRSVADKQLQEKIDEIKTEQFPSGGIIMWSGELNTIPKGWALCNGQNGTPDLRNQFVLGAGGKYKVGDHDGEETVTLSIANLPVHNHEIFIGSNTHSHKINGWPVKKNSNGKGGSNDCDEYSDVNNNKKTDNDTHTHSATVYNTGGGQSHNNMPPYYVLAYIMKL